MRSEEDYQEWLDYNIWGGLSCMDSHYLAVDLCRVLECAVGSHEMDEVWEAVMGGPLGIFIFGMMHPIRQVLEALPVVEDYQEWLGDPDWHAVMQAVKNGVMPEEDLRAVVHADILQQAWSTLRESVAATMDGSVWSAVWTVYLGSRL